MVRVPVQFLPQEQQRVGQPTQLQSHRAVPVQNFAPQQQEQLGKALEKVGGVAMRLGQDAQDEFDVAQTKKGENQLVQSMQRRLYDPKTGYLNTTGESATGENRTKVFDDLRDEMESIERGLGSETQKRLFRAAAEDRMLRAQGLADTHEAREIRSQSIGAADTRQGLAINDALATYGDGTDNFARFYGLVKQEANDKADLLGLPQDPKDPQRRALELDATTKLHNGVARKLLNQGKAAEAQGYLAAVSKEVAADVMVALQRDTATAVQQGATEAVAGELVRWADGLSEAALSTDDVATLAGARARPVELQVLAAQRFDELKAAGKVPPGVERIDVQRLVAYEANLREQQAHEAVIGVRAAAQRWVNEHPFAPITEMEPSLLRHVEAAGLFDETETYADKRRTVHNPRKWVDALILVETGAIANMSEAAVEAEFGGSLAPAYMERLRSMRKVKRGEAEEADKQIVAISDMVLRKAQKLLIVPARATRASWQDEDVLRFNAWEEAVQEQVSLLGHPATPKEMQVILDQLAMDIGTETVDWTHDTLPYAVMTEAEAEGSYVTLADKTTVAYTEFSGQQEQIRSGYAWGEYLLQVPAEQRTKLVRLFDENNDDLDKVMRALPAPEREHMRRALNAGAQRMTNVQVAEKFAAQQRQMGRRANSRAGKKWVPNRELFK